MGADGSTTGGTGTGGTGTGGLGAGGLGAGGSTTGGTTFVSNVQIVGVSPTEAISVTPKNGKLEYKVQDISGHGIPVTRNVRSSKSVSGDLWAEFYVTHHGAKENIRFNAGISSMGSLAYASDGHQPGTAILPDGSMVVASHMRVASKDNVAIMLNSSAGATLSINALPVPTGYRFSRSGGGGSDARITPLRDGSFLLTLWNGANQTITNRYTWSATAPVLDRTVMDSRILGFRAGSTVELRDGTFLMVERDKGQLVHLNSSFGLIGLSAMTGFSSAGLQVAQNVFEPGDEIVFACGQQTPPDAPTTTANILAFKQQGSSFVQVAKITLPGVGVNDISVVRASTSSSPPTGGSSF